MTETHSYSAAPGEYKPEDFVFFATRKQQRKFPQPAKKIVRERMSFIPATGKHDRAVIETEIGIPGNPFIENDAVIQCDYGSKNSINCYEKGKKRPF